MCCYCCNNNNSSSSSSSSSSYSSNSSSRNFAAVSSLFQCRGLRAPEDKSQSRGYVRSATERPGERSSRAIQRDRPYMRVPKINLYMRSLTCIHSTHIYYILHIRVYIQRERPKEDTGHTSLGSLKSQRRRQTPRRFCSLRRLFVVFYRHWPRSPRLPLRLGGPRPSVPLAFVPPGFGAQEGRRPRDTA